MTADPVPAWHQALAYALTGASYPALDPAVSPDVDRQPEPNLPQLVGQLEQLLPGGLAGLRRQVQDRRDRGEPWPYPVPSTLTRGIGAAQFVAVRDRLVAILRLGPPPRVRAARPRPLTAEERRLIGEVPPHSAG